MFALGVMQYQPKTTTLKCVLVRVVVMELILEYTLHRPNPLTLGSVLIPVMTNDSHTVWEHAKALKSGLADLSA